MKIKMLFCLLIIINNYIYSANKNPFLNKILNNKNFKKNNAERFLKNYKINNQNKEEQVNNNIVNFIQSIIKKEPKDQFENGFIEYCGDYFFQFKENIKELIQKNKNNEQNENKKNEIEKFFNFINCPFPYDLNAYIDNYRQKFKIDSQSDKIFDKIYNELLNMQCYNNGYKLNELSVNIFNKLKEIKDQIKYLIETSFLRNNLLFDFDNINDLEIKNIYENIIKSFDEIFFNKDDENKFKLKKILNIFIERIQKAILYSKILSLNIYKIETLKSELKTIISKEENRIEILNKLVQVIELNKLEESDKNQLRNIIKIFNNDSDNNINDNELNSIITYLNGILNNKSIDLIDLNELKLNIKKMTKILSENKKFITDKYEFLISIYEFNLFQYSENELKSILDYLSNKYTVLYYLINNKIINYSSSRLNELIDEILNYLNNNENENKLNVILKSLNIQDISNFIERLNQELKEKLIVSYSNKVINARYAQNRLKRLYKKI